MLDHDDRPLLAFTNSTSTLRPCYWGHFIDGSLLRAPHLSSRTLGMEEHWKEEFPDDAKERYVKDNTVNVTVIVVLSSGV